jgi:hypothetical protein
VLDSKDLSQLKEKTDELTRAIHQISQKLYESAQQTPPTGGSPEGPAPGPTESAETPSSGSAPVDADFKVVNNPPGDEKTES